MKMRNKKNSRKGDRFAGFLVDLFPDEFVEEASGNLFGKEMLEEKMDHPAVRESVIKHALMGKSPVIVMPQGNGAHAKATDSSKGVHVTNNITITKICNLYNGSQYVESIGTQINK